MADDFLDKMDTKELQSYIQFLLRQIQLVDAFWFLRIEDLFGLPQAELINARVWETVSGKAAKEIQQRFPSEEKGLKGLYHALQYFPWSRMIDYKITWNVEELVLEVPSCPPQEGRKKYNMGEYACKDMHRREFESFARIIDPGIAVHCDFAPPDPHPQDTYCRWRFCLKQEGSGG